MSTKAILALDNGDGFIGTHVHWNGNPSSMEEALRVAYTQLGGMQPMMHMLFVAHGGWSNICQVDWTKPVGYTNKYADHPMCRCHGDMSYEREVFTELSSTDHEYLYVLHAGSGWVYVHEHVGHWDGINEWKVIGKFNLKA